MFTASTRTLKLLAALAWYIGCAVLLLKGCFLLSAATDLHPGWNRPAVAGIAGVLAGLLRGRTLFRKVCRRNLDRISQLESPKIWQFFRPRFFLLLSLMMLAGVTLSRLAHGNYIVLIILAVLDLTVATALLVSSYVFWKQ
ncbi:MAG: hypothetical protein ABIA59_00750 [Candidatus Latescibacterota bacterium]